MDKHKPSGFFTAGVPVVGVFGVGGMTGTGGVVTPPRVGFNVGAGTPDRIGADAGQSVSKRRIHSCSEGQNEYPAEGIHPNSSRSLPGNGTGGAVTPPRVGFKVGAGTPPMVGFKVGLATGTDGVGGGGLGDGAVPGGERGTKSYG